MRVGAQSFPTRLVLGSKLPYLTISDHNPLPPPEGDGEALWLTTPYSPRPCAQPLHQVAAHDGGRISQPSWRTRGRACGGGRVMAGQRSGSPTAPSRSKRAKRHARTRNGSSRLVRQVGL